MRNIIKNPSVSQYEIIKKYECGIVLSGSEIKSIAKGQLVLKAAYIIIRKNEVFLVNAQVGKNQEKNVFDHDPTRTRKLLLHKSEILKINLEAKAKGYVMIPIRTYFVNSLLKIELGLGRHLKKHDKREKIKQKDLSRLNKI